MAAGVAELAGLEWLDLDCEIECAAGLTVTEIFAEQGETGFRALEREALRRVARREDVVVATGGGTVCDPDNAAVIERAGVSVWLRPPLATLLDRLAATDVGRRPLLGSRRQAERLYHERLAAYGRATYEVAVDPEETAAEVAARVWRLVERI